MADTRKKNFDWEIDTTPDGNTTASDAKLAVMMDIRDELQTLVRIFKCRNAQEIPEILRSIRRNTTPKKRKEKA